MGFKVQVRTDQFEADTGAECYRRVKEYVEFVKKYIQDKMAEPKSGRIYTIPGTKDTYQASAPGEYPAIRTSKLVNSLQTWAGRNRYVATGKVFSECEYADILEAGLRPFFQRAFLETQPDFQNILNRPSRQP